MDQRVYEEVFLYLKRAATLYPHGVPKRLIDLARAESKQVTSRLPSSIPFMLVCLDDELKDKGSETGSAMTLLQAIIEGALPCTPEEVAIRPVQAGENVRGIVEDLIEEELPGLTIFFGNYFREAIGSERVEQVTCVERVLERSCIFTHSLREIASDRARKREFWSILQDEIA